MSYVTVEDRVDRLEALFGQFMTELALQTKQANERERAAAERLARFEQEMREFKDEMREFKDEMREFKDGMVEFKNEMREFKDGMVEFKNEMREFKDGMVEFKDEMRESKRAQDLQWGRLANKLGTIIEDLLAPNLRRLARDHFRIDPILAFMIRCTRRRRDRLDIESEFDTLVVGPDAVILGEAKSTPSLEAADLLAGKAAGFFDFFPEYQGRRLIPILGSWSIPDPVIERLTVHRIYAMQMGEETMTLANAAAIEGTGRKRGKSKAES